jgi:serine phosphatase RsbU (regulator of sigma subunit)/anti-sigma regulatory factor (Ser/Thr protein kinase)
MERRGASVSERALAREYQASDLVARLTAVSTALGGAMTVDEVAGAVFAEAVRAVGADAGYLTVHVDGRLDVVAAIGIPQQDPAAGGSFTLDDDVPPVKVVRTGQPVFLSRREDVLQFAGADRVTASAAAALPLETDTVLGAIVLRYNEPQDFDEDTRFFLTAVARQAALALSRAQLWEAERRARAELETAQARLSFLARAGALVGQSLDLTTTLARVTDVCVPEFADSALVELVDERGELQLARLVHRDTGVERLLRSMLDRYPHTADERYPGRTVLETGRPVFVRDIPVEALATFARDEQHHDLLVRTRVSSAMTLPLMARGRRIGVLSLGREPGADPFDDEDLELAEQLALRVALAIDNARLLAERSAVVRSLQASLLPPHMPDVPGLDLAARYHPAGGDADVGGDFYDVFPLSGDAWGVVIGDVTGKGTEAAALTALSRYTVRGAAMREPSPARVLEVVNRAILGSRSGERFATMVLAVVEPSGDGMRVRLASGGHPSPLLLTSYGSVQAISAEGCALGMFPDAQLEEAELVLRPGDSLVLFTDGLIEARRPDGSFAPDLVHDVLRLATGLSAEEIAGAVEKAVFDLEQGHHRDDLALLVVRVPHQSETPARRFEIAVDRARSGVPAARRAVTEFLHESEVAQEALDDIGLVVTELCTNAIRAARTQVLLRAWCDDASVTIEVEDDGPGFDPSVAKAERGPDPELEVGRGLWIVDQLVDELTTRFDPSGTVVRCRFALR